MYCPCVSQVWQRSRQYTVRPERRVLLLARYSRTHATALVSRRACHVVMAHAPVWAGCWRRFNPCGLGWVLASFQPCIERLFKNARHVATVLNKEKKERINPRFETIA